MLQRLHTRRTPHGSLALCAAAIVLAIGTTTAPFRAFAVGGGCERQIQVRLFFGLHGAAGTISEPEWAQFLNDIITPRFPDGLTVFEASGQWRRQGSRLEHEPARVVEIIHDDSPEARSFINQIVTVYKARHQQQSVMVTRAHIDVCF